MAKLMQKANTKCATRSCHAMAASRRARFCRACFLKQAKRSNGMRLVRRGGYNKGGKGVIGNKGGKGVIGNKGGKGAIGNRGNGTVGKQRATRSKHAGKRSGQKRCAKYALLVKAHWLQKIFTREKVWEIRGSMTTRRGWIHFAESKAGGKLVGRARLVGCVEIPRQHFSTHFEHHRVADAGDVPYKRIFAWKLDGAERFEKPFVYKHKPGAVIWASV